ncbi:hypothetical protein PHMEG_00013492 [Phytophthora megakarya]|uniref:Uncharacterized protein n=1 Tax=Phytophthora megakarya TaxID=4795 RepID=A0A225W6L6_9STRA|nr:hypothetical protein PHMEG_00013492 [Phytophthora megakarya]
MYFSACVALTNVQVRDHLLRATDGVRYRDYLRRLNHIDTTGINRRRESNRCARERRQTRLATEVPPANIDESDDGRANSDIDDELTQLSTKY